MTEPTAVQNLTLGAKVARYLLAAGLLIDGLGAAIVFQACHSDGQAPALLGASLIALGAGAIGSAVCALAAVVAWAAGHNGKVALQCLAGMVAGIAAIAAAMP